MGPREDVCVLIPTLDEAETVGGVIDGLRHENLENILVIDGGSSDGTREIALGRGARVIQQSGRGKGQAVREAIGKVDAEYVLMLDGDGTYRPEDARKMLEPLLTGRAEHVIGNRFGDMEGGAMTKLNKVGNRIINRVFELVHGRDFVDILSGYRAFTRRSVDPFLLSSDGFGIETELAVECAKHDIPTEVVSVGYLARPSDSETNLRPFRDGSLILVTLYRLAKTNNPLFYFGCIGCAFSVFGFGTGLYVLAEWMTRGISHEIIAIASASAILFGVQLMMFGLLSDMIIALHREQLKRLE